MTDDTRLQTLAPLLSNLFRIDEAEIRPGLTPEDVPTWDSLSHLQMVMAVEEAFGVELTTREATSIESVQDLLDLLDSKGAAAP